MTRTDRNDVEKMIPSEAIKTDNSDIIRPKILSGFVLFGFLFWIVFAEGIYYSVLYFRNRKATVDEMNTVIEQGNYNKVYQMTEKFPELPFSLDEIGSNGLTPLITALSFPSEHQTKIIRLLIQRGADVSAPAKAGITPLMAGIAKKTSQENIELLLEDTENINTLMAKNLTPLLISIKKDMDLSFIELLLKKGANPNVVSTENENPLLLALKKNNTGLFKLLMRYGASVTFYVNGSPVMHTLAKAENEAFFEKVFNDLPHEKMLLLTRQLTRTNVFYPNVVLFYQKISDFEERNKLFLSAAKYGNTKAMLALSDIGVNLFYKENNHNAFDFLKKPKKENVKDIAKLKALRKSAQDLFVAVQQNNKKEIDRLIDNKNILLNTDENGNNLITAGFSGKMGYDTYKRLLEMGLLRNKAEDEKSFFMFTLQNNPDLEMIRLALDSIPQEKLEPEIAFLMLSNPNPDAVELLLTRYPEWIESKNSQNESLFYAAIKSGNEPVIKKLIEKRVEENVCSSEQDDFLFQAVYAKMSPDLLKIFIEKGCNVLQKTEQGDTLLIAAVKSGNAIETLTFLVQSGINPKDKNNKQETAYSVALSLKNKKAAAYLKPLSVEAVKPQSKKKKKAEKKQ